MKVTMADIARRVGVTPSTVQRALSGLPGVGDEKREQILRAAEEMGYRCNYIASALKKGGSHIAVLLPAPEGASRFFMQYLWDGVQSCLEEFSSYEIHAETLTYAYTPAAQAHALKQIAARSTPLHGLLTMGTNTPQVRASLEAIAAKGTALALLGSDLPGLRRLCCVGADEELAGRLAADLIINFIPCTAAPVLLTGDFAKADQSLNAHGFEQQLWTSGRQYDIIKQSATGGVAHLQQLVQQQLAPGRPLPGVIYATGARNTVAACQAVQQLPAARRPHLLGSDIFAENIAFIQSGVLHAVLHKRPREQAFTALQNLINGVLQRTPPAAATTLIQPVLAMRSNVQALL